MVLHFTNSYSYFYLNFIIEISKTLRHNSIFYLLQLQVSSSKKSAERIQMPGAEKGTILKTIVSKSMVDDLKISKGLKVECKLKKVSLDLWRVQTISLKASASKQKKK